MYRVGLGGGVAGVNMLNMRAEKRMGSDSVYITPHSGAALFYFTALQFATPHAHSHQHSSCLEAHHIESRPHQLNSLSLSHSVDPFLRVCVCVFK